MSKKRIGYLRLIEHYGVNTEIKKLEEEVVELYACIKNNDNSEKSINSIAKRLANCHLLLTEIKDYYKIGVTDIKIIATKELRKRLEEIEKE